MVENITSSQVSFSEYEDNIYFLILHVNGICCTFATAFAVYFICYKSPSYMNDYKFFLLNISITSFLFDCFATLLWLPAPFFPALVMCSYGVLGKLGYFWGGTISFVIYLTLCTMCSISVIWAFIYRWALITNRGHYCRTKIAMGLMLLAQLFYEFPTVVFYLLLMRTRSQQVAATIAKYPNLAPYLLPETKPCAVSSFDASILTWIFMTTLATEFSLPIPMALFLLYLCNRALDQRKDHMSSKTIKMHRTFLKSLILQLIIPFVSLFVPFSINAILLLFKIENLQTLHKILFLLGNLHTTLNTLMLLMSIEPYRKEIRSHFFKVMEKLHLYAPEHSETEVKVFTATSVS